MLVDAQLLRPMDTHKPTSNAEAWKAQAPSVGDVLEIGIFSFFWTPSWLWGRLGQHAFLKRHRIEHDER
jgi:hypothetical protein